MMEDIMNIRYELHIIQETLKMAQRRAQQRREQPRKLYFDGHGRM